ncbi:hypothetical protein ACFJIW_06735 [Tahibacter sp. UC22_41]|uniref:hypothetical protein n=1 Tax=Tahibacter sp. UC22_41 TaxID=3350178 RepID=UPI0036DF40D6
MTVMAAALLAAVYYYRHDEAPTPDALRWSSPPARTVADADNAWLHLIGNGAAENVDPLLAGRQRATAYLAQADSHTPMDSEADQAVPVVEVDPDRDGFAVPCRPALGDCFAWARQHRAAMTRLLDANRLRLSRLDHAAVLPQWQEAPLRSTDFPMIPASTIRLQIAGLALRAIDADVVETGQKIAAQAGLWRRVAEQSDWLIDKLFAVSFLADHRRLLVDLYANATAAQRAALDDAVDAVLAAPSAAENNLDVAVYDNVQVTAASLRRELPGVLTAVRNCWRGDEAPTGANADTPPDSCANRIADSFTYLPQATINTHARLADAEAAHLAAMPAEEPVAQQRYDQAVQSVLPPVEPERRWLPLRYNAGGLHYLRKGKDLIGDYRRHLNDQELLRRLLAIRVAALRADVTEADMATFIAAQPAELRHPYPDRTISWDGVRGVITAPTVVDGLYDEGRIDLRYRGDAKAETTAAIGNDS